MQAQNEGCWPHLIGSSDVLYYKGVKGANGIYVHCDPRKRSGTNRVNVKSYTIKVVRNAKTIKVFKVRGHYLSLIHI